MVEFDEDIVADIRQCPRKHFAQFFYSTDTLSTLQLLNHLVEGSDGQKIVLECLYCWQDIVGVDHCLEVLASELTPLNNPEVLCTCVALINRLIMASPDSVTRIRLFHELEAIDVDSKICSLRQTDYDERTNHDELVRERLLAQIDVWCSLLDEGRERTSSGGHQPSLAEGEDSGAFSEESDEELTMNDVHLEKNLPFRQPKSIGKDDPKYLDYILVQLVNFLRGKTDSACMKVVETILSISYDKVEVDTILRLLKRKNSDSSQESIARTSPPPLPPQPLPPRPPPPPVKASVPPPPPPPFANTFLLQSRLPTQAHNIPSVSSDPPSPPVLPQNANGSSFRPLLKRKIEIPPALLPKCLPKEGAKLKQIQWTKLPAEKVVTNNPKAKTNVWLSSAELSNKELEVDFNKLESLFMWTEPSASTDGTSSLERKKDRKSDHISLLSYKRSFSVSIFLKQFKDGWDILIENIKKGRCQDIGLERLSALLTILPDDEEVQILRGFTGEVSQLGIAERFFLSLLAVDDYRLRVEFLTLKGELLSAIDNFRPQIDLIISASTEIRQSYALRRMLYLLLQIGNFLNANGFCGNAVGFKLNSLWKVIDLKATSNGLTLLHFIAMQSSSTTEQLFNELGNVPAASKLSVETLKADIRNLSDKLRKVEGDMKRKNVSAHFSEVPEYFEVSRIQMMQLENGLERVNGLITELAQYFCEDPKSFKLEECFKIFAAFIHRLREAMKDNIDRDKRQRRHEMQVASQSVRHSHSSTDAVSSSRPSSKRVSLLEVLENDESSFRQRTRTEVASIAPEIILDKEDLSVNDARVHIRHSLRRHSTQSCQSAEVSGLPSVMDIRRQSRYRSDAFLLRNSNNLDDFLEMAEKVEKGVIGKNTASLISEEANVNVHEVSAPSTSLFPPIIEDDSKRQKNITKVMPKIIHALTSETESQSKNNVEPIIRDVTVKKTAPFHKTSSKVNKSIGKTGTDEERSATSTRMITEIGRIRTQKKNGLPRLIKDRTNSAKSSNFRHKEESFAPESASVRSPNITADVLIRNKPEVFLMEDHVELNAKQLSSPRKTNSFSEKPRLTVPIIRSPAKTTGTNNAINNVRQSARSKQCQTLKSSHSPRARSSTPSNSNFARTGTSARSVQVFETSINNPLTHHSELLEFCAEEKAQMRCRLKVHSSDCSLLPTNVRKQRVTFRNAPHSSSPRLRNPQLVRNSGVSNNMKVKNRMPIPLRSLSTSPRCVSPPSLPSAQGNTRLTRPPCTRFPSTDASITPRSHPRPPVITNHGSITEKTKINAKHSGSCSTASRPSLIKTGSQSRPVWR